MCAERAPALSPVRPANIFPADSGAPVRTDRRGSDDAHSPTSRVSMEGNPTTQLAAIDYAIMAVYIAAVLGV